VWAGRSSGDANFPRCGLLCAVDQRTRLCVKVVGATSCVKHHVVLRLHLVTYGHIDSSP
jgi:hypothetical protein